MNKFARTLAIDLGASSGRGIVFEFHSDKYSQKIVHRFPNGAKERNGRLYWDISMLFENICEAIRLADKQCGKIDAVGIDTWGVDVGFIGKDGKILGDPFCYSDPSNAKARRAYSEYSRDLYSIAGISDNDFNTTYQLLARHNEGFDFTQVERILFMPQLIGYLLTGKAVTEATIASTSGFYSQKDGFDQKFLDWIGIEKTLFPPTLKTGEKIGCIKDEIKNKIGLTYDIPVVATAGHDTACAVHTLSAVEERPLYLSSGTWSLFGTLEDEPIVSDAAFEAGYTNELAFDGRVRFLRNIMGMWIIQECRKQWAQEGGELSYDEIVELAKSAEDKGAFIDVNDSAFAYPGNMSDKVRDYVLQKQGIELQSVG
ncbi:MAG: rhamnulokinase, partial [Clostridia bacterium]|nr:rhamnulokinase [Clostridia bacterium]